MSRILSETVSICLLASVWFVEQSSAAVLPHPEFPASTDLLNADNGGVKPHPEHGHQISRNTRSVLDEDYPALGVADEDTRNAYAQEYIEHMLSNNERNTMLDIAIERYIAKFYSDLLELIQTELMEKETPAERQPSKHGRRKSYRRRTRPKRSIGH